MFDFHNCFKGGVQLEVLKNLRLFKKNSTPQCQHALKLRGCPYGLFSAVEKGLPSPKTGGNFKPDWETTLIEKIYQNNV